MTSPAVQPRVLRRIGPQLISKGRVSQPGIDLTMLDEQFAARLGIMGLAVIDVLPDSAAERAGLSGLDLSRGELGDIIVAVNGEPDERC